VTIAASSDPITFGQATTLSGKVLGPRDAHLTVTLESAPTLGGPWVTNRQRITGANRKTGAYSFAGLAPSSNIYYRTVADGVYSPAVQVLVGFRVGLLVSTRHPSAGSLVRFHGRVAPAHRGLRVWIQRLGSDRHWHIIKRTRLRGLNPRFSFYSVRVPVARSGLYRVVVKHDLDHAKGVSQIVRIRVH
jgi:hypothetical protein